MNKWRLLTSHACIWRLGCAHKHNGSNTFTAFGVQHSTARMATVANPLQPDSIACDALLCCRMITSPKSLKGASQWHPLTSVVPPGFRRPLLTLVYSKASVAQPATPTHLHATARLTAVCACLCASVTWPSGNGTPPYKQWTRNDGSGERPCIARTLWQSKGPARTNAFAHVCTFTKK
jgi:hypothetical protein